MCMFVCVVKYVCLFVLCCDNKSIYCYGTYRAGYTEHFPTVPGLYTVHVCVHCIYICIIYVVSYEFV